MSEYPQQQNGYMATPQEEIVPIISIGGWLKLSLWLLLGFIPVIGWLALLAVYIIKMVSTDTPASIRNFLKAYGVIALILMGVTIVFAALFSAALLALFAGFASAF